jgi:hypothetical protein
VALLVQGPGEHGHAGHPLRPQLVTKTDGGLRHLNVWESRQDWERYRDERVGPTVGRVLAAAGIDRRPPEPDEQRLDVVDVVTAG